MSSTPIFYALDAPADVSPTERLILARHAAPDGGVTMSAVELAQKSNVSTAAVTRALQRLWQLRLIQRVVGTGAGAWSWRVGPPLTGRNSTGEAGR